jgi:hypothetical protein
MVLEGSMLEIKMPLQTFSVHFDPISELLKDYQRLRIITVALLPKSRHIFKYYDQHNNKKML